MRSERYIWRCNWSCIVAGLPISVVAVVLCQELSDKQLLVQSQQSQLQERKLGKDSPVLVVFVFEPGLARHLHALGVR